MLYVAENFAEFAVQTMNNVTYDMATDVPPMEQKTLVGTTHNCRIIDVTESVHQPAIPAKEGLTARETRVVHS
jgi:hypothetical protein